MSHTLKIKCEIISPEYFRYYEHSLATDFFYRKCLCILEVILCNL